MNRKKSIQNICLAGVIAAIYVALTELSALFGLSSHAIQVRISEALCILVCFTPAAIPGVTIGCLISNLLTSGNLFDILFGSLATLIGASIGYLIRRMPYLVPAPTVIANTLIVPFVIKYAFGFNSESLSFIMLTVGIGEIISAWILGILLFKALERSRVLRGLLQ